MNIEEVKKQVITQLLQFSSIKGYITLNDIFTSVETASLPIDEVDRLCDILISKNVIIRDDVKNEVEPLDNNVYDKSQLDYDAIYRRAIKIDQSLMGYIEKLSVITPPRLGEEANLVLHSREGNTYAHDRIITMYLKVALRLAISHYNKYGYSLDETIQDANIGLLLALERIDLSSGKRYSSYAPWWIRQYIGRQTQGVSRTFYQFPVHIKDKLILVIAIKRKHDCVNCEEYGYCTYLVKEVCSKLEINEDKAHYYLKLLENPISIEETIENEKEDLFSDNCIYVNNILDNLHYELLKNNVSKILLTLKDREREVLELRFGLIDGQQRTLEEVGTVYGVTRERIRQIESKALNRLRHHSRSKQLKQFYRI
jgi:RNA polymerase primary sigma factor